MPSLESVRRIVGSGIIQKYITDDESSGLTIKTGIATIPTTKQSFYQWNVRLDQWSTVSERYIEVTGLGFKPKFIICYDMLDDEPIVTKFFYDSHMIMDGYEYYNSLLGVGRVSGNAYVNSNGFKLGGRIGTSTTLLDWIAIG